LACETAAPDVGQKSGIRTKKEKIKNVRGKNSC